MATAKRKAVKKTAARRTTTSTRRVVGRRPVAANASAAVRFIPLNASGKPVKAGEAVAILHDTTTGLWWPRETHACGSVNDAESAKAIAEMRLGGKSDWRLPTVQELLSLVEYTRHFPAINPAFECKSGWYRTSTKYAGSPDDLAWFVGFYYGGSGVNHRGSGGFLRACRPSQ